MTNTISLNSIGIGRPPIQNDAIEIDDNSSLVSAGRRYEKRRMNLRTIVPWYQQPADTR